MPPRSTPTSRKPASRSSAAAVAERLSVRQTRMTGLSLKALISASRFGSSPTGRFAAIGDVAERTRKFVRPAHVDQRDAWALLEEALKLIHLDRQGIDLNRERPFFAELGNNK